ncbi:hypothetical protein BC628DRAFT_1178282 [Trametes gibbosa]|nr:hypothetical protein BC628DRAFT_1178282 [Trametes gibbosa]
MWLLSHLVLLSPATHNLLLAMADDSEKLLAKLDALNDSLDDLEGKLEPLFAQTLPETLLPLETIQQVKLNVAIPYLVYDLMFIYLKTRGIDPKTHPVVAELDRVKQYFDKIKNAEDPEKRNTALDKAAANRFIKHAIAQVRAQDNARSGPSHIRFDAPSSGAGAASPAAAAIPVKITSKMRARAEYERALAAQGSDEDEEEDGLEVFGDDDDGPETKSSKGKGKERATDDAGTPDAPGAKKRRRPAVDPFASYGDDRDAKPAKATKKKKKKAAAENEDVAMDSETVGGNSGSNTPGSAKQDQKAAKKAKKKSKRSSLG